MTTEHPVTRYDAAQINLYDHLEWTADVVARVDQRKSGDAADHLEEISRSAEIVHQLDSRQAINIHRAVLAGAALTDITKALGERSTDVVDRWRRWSNGQRQLRKDGIVLASFDPDEHDQVAATLTEQLTTATS